MLHIMQQVAKVDRGTPAAATLAAVLLALIRRVSDAVCQHRNVAPRAVCHMLVPTDETPAAARERRHQKLREQVGFSPELRREESANRF
jgi:hypothetical protein